MKRSKSLLLATLTIVLCLFVCGRVRAQGDVVKNDGITAPIHQANVGRIVFTAKPVPIENLKPADFITTAELRAPADLSLRAFMGNSLTNYLHKLQPHLTVEELNRQGSYQFSFFVDGVLVHEENLNPYWVREETKIKLTTLGFALLNSAEPDSAGAGARIWQLFLMNGGQQALTAGTHRLMIELRPYLKTSETKVGDLIAAGEIQVVVPAKRKSDETLAAIQPIRPNSGWQISKAPYDRTRIEELNRMIAANVYKEITSVVVIRDGGLLIEEYFNGATRDTLHNTRSVGKSFASTMMGMAIQDGYIKSENQTLKDFYVLKRFANYSPQKESVTLKNLLTMSSAFDGNDDDENSPGNEEKMYPTGDWIKFALDLPMDQKRKAGEKWAYFTTGVVLLGDIINKSVPEGLEKYADRKLFKPLGITKYQWQYTPQKVPSTAGGLQLSALDFAKFGQLYQNGGSWNGKQLLARDWVQKTFTKQIVLSPGGSDFYGYLFWNTTFTIGGKRHEAFFATGNGGSKIFVFKDQPLVIVVTGTAYGKWYMHAQVFSMMSRYILPAVIN
ncbi:MAG TPA: serine hydrolase [Pyrinomonadaceae bacterium]|nr:serine hydrolase [Pyrinomonadaceae bacterium]